METKQDEKVYDMEWFKKEISTWTKRQLHETMIEIKIKMKRFPEDRPYFEAVRIEWRKRCAVERLAGKRT